MDSFCRFLMASVRRDFLDKERARLILSSEAVEMEWREILLSDRRQRRCLSAARSRGRRWEEFEEQSLVELAGLFEGCDGETFGGEIHYHSRTTSLIVVVFE